MARIYTVARRLSSALMILTILLVVLMMRRRRGAIDAVLMRPLWRYYSNRRQSRALSALQLWQMRASSHIAAER